MAQTYILDIAERRATITLNRPERHNALKISDLDALEAAIGEVLARPEVRVLVFTGAGNKTFCSGADLGDVAGEDWTVNPLERFCTMVERLALPTVCAINGSVFGGGTELALACDFRIGVRGMTCFVPAARFGIHYQVDGIRRAVERIGLGAAKRMFLAAETFSDEELLRLNFLDHLVAPEDFPAFVDDYVANLAAMAPLALAGMKRTMNAVSRGDLDEERARADCVACWRSEDFREGMASRAEKRKPEFKGR